MASDLLPTTPAFRKSELTHREVSAPLPQPSGNAEVEGWELVRRYLAAVIRYKWLLVLLLLAGSGASIALTRFVHPVYEVQATIWVATQTPETRTVGPIRAHE